MGYSIHYDTCGVVKGNAKKASRRKKRLLPRLLAVCIVVLTIFTDLRQLVWDMFFPGAGESTQTAFIQMVADLREGDSVKEAFSAFCVEILEHGKS